MSVWWMESSDDRFGVINKEHYGVMVFSGVINSNALITQATR